MFIGFWDEFMNPKEQNGNRKGQAEAEINKIFLEKLKAAMGSEGLVRSSQLSKFKKESRLDLAPRLCENIYSDWNLNPVI